MIITFEQPQIKNTLPYIMKSSFQFKNGRKITIMTRAFGWIKSFECDENWYTFSEPFAECPLSWSDKTDVEYHIFLREKLHKKEHFVPEHSTPIHQ